MAAVAQPSGTVTLVFADIEGSTRLLEELGVDAYRDALAEHRRVVRAACARHHGYEVDYEGDAFFYAFASAQGAVSAVGEAMAGLDGGPIKIRVGIHTGEPALDGPNYIGLDVHRAARIMSAAHGGQVVLSPATVALLDGGVQLKALGRHRLKDLSEPIALHQLLVGCLPGEFPPLQTLYRSNLPVPATPFLGREREVAEVASLLADAGTRLLTLTGPGGTGKTRLALQAAAEVSERFPDGITWVPLAPLRDASSLLPAVQHALGLPERAGEAPAEAVTRALSGKQALVLLDNAEHLLPGVAEQLAAVSDACPDLSLLVTSRERLRLGVETSWPVPPLEESDGERLFVERARAAGVELADDSRVTDLCRRLDELPLALELAAARTVVFSPAQLLERLGERLDLLQAGRDADPRQQTLRATIEWSYQLLDEVERGVYRALSVFPGGCTFDATEDVAGAEADTLQSLIDKSLVRVREENDERRFWMLETIREHAREQLQASRDALDVERRRARWLLKLAREGAEKSLSLERDAWVARLDAEHANIVETLSWGLDVDVGGSLRLATAVSRAAWDGGPRLREGRQLLQATLDRAGSEDESERAAALFALGRLLWVEDDRAAERGAFEACIALAAAAGDASTMASAQVELGWTALAEASLAEARSLADAAASAAARGTDPLLAQRALQLQGGVAEAEGDLEESGRRFEEALRLARSVGNRRGEGTFLGNLGWLAAVRQDYEEAAKRFHEHLALTVPSDIENLAILHGNLGLVSLFLGRREASVEHLSLCLRFGRELGMLRSAAEALTGLAAHAATSGDAERALTLWAASDALYASCGSRPTVVEERLRATFLEPLREAGASLPSTAPTTLDGAADYALAGAD